MRNQLASDINEGAVPNKKVVQAQFTIDLVKSTMRCLPQDKFVLVEEIAKQIRKLVEDNLPYGDIALALIGAERELAVVSKQK